jgi:hypothetical protein
MTEIKTRSQLDGEPQQSREAARQLTSRKEEIASLTPMQEQLCEDSRWDFSDLNALYINCTLKRSPEVSNTQALADRSIEIMRRNGVSVESIRAIDHDIATGVQPDMTEHGWERDGWPAIFEKVLAADILVRAAAVPRTTSPIETRRS